jgi:hypothetical protein
VLGFCVDATPEAVQAFLPAELVEVPPVADQAEARTSTLRADLHVGHPSLAFSSGPPTRPPRRSCPGNTADRPRRAAPLGVCAGTAAAGHSRSSAAARRWSAGRGDCSRSALTAPRSRSCRTRGASEQAECQRSAADRKALTMVHRSRSKLDPCARAAISQESCFSVALRQPNVARTACCQTRRFLRRGPPLAATR